MTEREVVFSARAYHKGGKPTVRMEGAEFVRRFMQHILPTGIKRIRHYGVLASACKGDALARSRAAAEDDCAQHRSLGVRNRVPQAGGACGRAAVPVLHAWTLARGGVAGRTKAPARTVRHRAAPGAGAAMTELWGLAPVLAAVRNDVPGRGAGKAQCSGAQSARNTRNSWPKVRLQTPAFVHSANRACRRSKSPAII